VDTLPPKEGSVKRQELGARIQELEKGLELEMQRGGANERNGEWVKG